jgi:hypothetical protein
LALGAVTTPDAIAAFLGAKGLRQGFYYLQAARILGLIAESGGDGTVSLTAYGRAFASYDRSAQRRALRHPMLRAEPMRSVVAALAAGDGLTMERVTRIVQRLAPLALSTARRRAQTMISWLRALGLIERRDDRLYYVGPLLASAHAA